MQWNRLRCVHFFVQLLRAGIPITLLSVWAVGYVAWDQLRTAGRRGSLVLPSVIGLVVFFVMMFAVVYPFDDNVVLNPRYLLPAAAPIAACLGMRSAPCSLPRARGTCCMCYLCWLFGLWASWWCSSESVAKFPLQAGLG
jgi:hypothetical protein